MALASNALTTVSKVEDELGITPGSEDTRLERLINEASAICDSFAGRVFARDTAVEETVRADEGPYLFVGRPPINSITSIEFLGSEIGSSDYEIYNADRGIVYAINGSWARLDIHYQDSSQTSVAGQTRKAYTVTYDGGYYTQAQEDAGGGAITRNLPYDIERACVSLVSYLRRNLGRDLSVTREQLLDSSVAWGSIGGGGSRAGGHWLQATLPLVAAVLNTYKVAILR